MKDGTLFKTKWFEIWWHPITPFVLYLNAAGYFSPYPELFIGLFGLTFYFRIPIKTKYDECEPPYYGIYILDHALTIHWGRKSILFWELPFLTWKMTEHCIDVKDRGFVKADVLEKENPKDYWDTDWRKEHFNAQVLPYVDSYDGEVVNATIWQEYRIWKRKWLTWLPFWEEKHDYIEIVFDKEVGKEKGSWKGGCIGCRYDLKPGETAEECLKRMEKENFN